MKDLFTSILNIFRCLGKGITFFRNFFFNLLFLFILLVLFFSLFAKEEFIIQDNTALLLTIAGDIVEEKQVPDSINDFLDNSFGIANLPEETLLQDVVDSIKISALDDRINSIVLDLSNMRHASINQLEDIGDALEDFKSTGKKVIAAEDFYSQNRYFLASYCTDVFLNPVGLVDLHGFGVYRLYYKDALDKLKINYHIFRVGTYKSALEPITRNSMSQYAKYQNEQWLKPLWQNFSEGISKRRNIPIETINSYTNEVSSLLLTTKGDTAQLALNLGLVDGLKSREELRSYFADLTGNEGANLKYVSLKNYLNKAPPLKNKNNKNKVGVIIAQGNILSGEQPPGSIGSETLINLIRKARNDYSIKALVLRINSGGGSVFASEMIRKELQEVKKEDIPLVISMGSVAASGGYWISAEADEIWAHSTTLTGSIGIFGAIPTFEKSLGHLGIYSDGVGTTKLSAGLDITQPINKEVKNAIQLSINHGYNKFLEIVANGRGIDKEKLDSIAEGRVFDGKQAQSLGLVDYLGNLDDAVDSAATLAGLEDYSRKYISRPATLQERIFQRFGQNIRNTVLKSLLPSSILRKFEDVSATNPIFFNDPRGLYAHWLINYY